WYGTNKKAGTPAGRAGSVGTHSPARRESRRGLAHPRLPRDSRTSLVHTPGRQGLRRRPGTRCGVRRSSLHTEWLDETPSDRNVVSCAAKAAELWWSSSDIPE